MKKLMIVACCAAFVGGTTATYAQFVTGGAEMNADKSSTANANAKMKKKMSKPMGGEAKGGEGTMSKGGAAK